MKVDRHAGLERKWDLRTLGLFGGSLLGVNLLCLLEEVTDEAGVDGGEGGKVEAEDLFAGAVVKEVFGGEEAAFAEA